MAAPDAAGGRAVGAADADDLLAAATRRLRDRAGDRAGARLESEVLLASVLGVERARLPGVRRVSPEDVARFEALVEERVRTARPVAYLVGRRGFHELDLAVDERVLVPRPETEHVVEAVLRLAAEGRLPPGPVVDRGTGSGAIALALRGRVGRPVLALDLSAGALEVAADNGRRVTAARARDGAPDGTWGLVRADGLGVLADGSVAVVVANPPYVTAAEHAALPDDVRLHEPREALVAGEGGPDAMYRRLAREAARVLRPGGWLVTEVGAGQAGGLTDLLADAGWTELAVDDDLAGIPRVVRGRRPAD